MGDQGNGNIFTLRPRRGKQREREPSGVEPFLRRRYRGRERIHSRIVSIRSAVFGGEWPDPLEIFFGLG